MIRKKNNLGKSVMALFLGFNLFLVAGIRIPYLDDNADKYFDKAIIQASVAYGICRVSNATISVVKDSSIAASPAGIGIFISVGQILDPIDDMIERLSDVLVTAMVTLGLQKLLYEMTVTLAPTIMATLLIGISVLSLFNFTASNQLQKLLFKITLLVLVARLSLPVSSLANDFLHTEFFSKKIDVAKQNLSLGSKELEKLNEISFPKSNGFFSAIKSSATYMKKKAIAYKSAIVMIVKNAGNIIHNLLMLTFLYVGVFVIQSILLPILTFWILAKIVKALFDKDVPSFTYHRNPMKA